MDNMEVSCHLSNGPIRIAFGVLLYLSDDIFHILRPWKLDQGFLETVQALFSLVLIQ